MSVLNDTHDPARRSWLVAANLPHADFPLQNLPFGVFEHGGTPRGGVAIGDRIRWSAPGVAPACASGGSSVNALVAQMVDYGCILPALEATAKWLADQEAQARKMRLDSGATPKL